VGGIDNRLLKRIPGKLCLASTLQLMKKLLETEIFPKIFLS
jgi:hypothetical protein